MISQFHFRPLVWLLVFTHMTGFSAYGLVSTPEEEDEGFKKWQKFLSSHQSLDDETALRELAIGFRKLSDPSIYHERERADSLAKDFKNSILSYPNHGEFFINEFESLREQAQRVPGVLADYRRKRMYSGMTLQMLASLQTVIAVIPLLNDEQRLLQPGATEEPAGSNKFFAAAVLREVIATPPKEPAVKVSTSEWKEWRDEVQAGRLAFRLKDDPTWYSFDGPIPQAEQTHISSEGRRRTPARTSATNSNPTPNKSIAVENENNPSSTRTGLWVAVSLLILSLLAFLSRHKIWKS